MIDAFNTLNGMGWSSIVLVLLLLIILVPTIVENLNKTLKVLGLRKVVDYEKQELNSELDGFKARLDELETNQKEMKSDMKEIKETLNKYVDTTNATTVATCRSSLWRMHREFVKDGYITPDGLKTFSELGACYEAAGGDDIYHSKLKPEVEELPIKYEQNYL